MNTNLCNTFFSILASQPCLHHISAVPYVAFPPFLEEQTLKINVQLFHGKIKIYNNSRENVILKIWEERELVPENSDQVFVRKTVVFRESRKYVGPATKNIPWILPERKIGLILLYLHYIVTQSFYLVIFKYLRLFPFFKKCLRKSSFLISNTDSHVPFKIIFIFYIFAI